MYVRYSRIETSSRLHSGALETSPLFVETCFFLSCCNMLLSNSNTYLLLLGQLPYTE